MARVVHGVSTTWDPSVATIRFPGRIRAAAWSPCSRFIATAYDNSPGIVILDAVTLEQHHVMISHVYVDWSYITFSPDGHLLTGYSLSDDCIMTWDLQTGGLLTNINTSGWGGCSSVAYSGCGTMVGGVFDNTTIIICNVLSGTHAFSHEIPQCVAETSWAHGEHLWFVTGEFKSITIWQVSFTSNHMPIEVGSFSSPSNWPLEDLILLPTLLWFAFIFCGKVLVWDAQNNKVLLESANIGDPRAMSFSPDGHFFVCGRKGREFHIWKNSPAGYLPHQVLVSGDYNTTPLVSPDGESVVSFGGKVLQLWHTENSSIPLPSTSVQASRMRISPLIEFSPDDSLVAITKRLSRRVIVLDIKSGSPWLVVDTDTKTCGLRITGDKVVVVGDGKVVTWDLPARDCVSSTIGNIKSSVQATIFENSSPVEHLYAAISPNLEYLALLGLGDLFIYNMHTGEKLTAVGSDGEMLGFSPYSNEVWCATDEGEVGKWKMFERDGSNTVELKQLERDVKPQSGFPWHSPCGYQVTDCGWIISSSGRRLLWLPHNWQQDEITQRKWSGKFLAIWNWSTLEPILLELLV